MELEQLTWKRASYTEQAHARVAAGVAWLDEHEPDWFHYINLETLDMRGAEHCIGAQVYQRSHPQYSWSSYGHFVIGYGLNVDRQEELGFLSLDTGVYRYLQQAWETAILHKRLSSLPELAGAACLDTHRVGWLAEVGTPPQPAQSPPARRWWPWGRS